MIRANKKTKDEATKRKPQIVRGEHNSGMFDYNKSNQQTTTSPNKPPTHHIPHPPNHQPYTSYRRKTTRIEEEKKQQSEVLYKTANQTNKPRTY